MLIFTCSAFGSPTPSHNEKEYDSHYIPTETRYEKSQPRYDGYHETNSVHNNNGKNQSVPNKEKNRSKSRQIAVRPIKGEDSSSSDDNDDSDDERLDDSEDDLPMNLEYMLRHPLKSQGQVHDMIHKVSSWPFLRCLDES